VINSWYLRIHMCSSKWWSIKLYSIYY